MTLFKHEFIISIWLSEKGFDTSANQAKMFTSGLQLLTMVEMCLESYLQTKKDHS